MSGKNTPLSLFRQPLSQQLHRRLGGARPRPPFDVRSITPGSEPGRYRLEIEISWEVAEFLATISVPFYKLFGKVQEEVERRQDQDARRHRAQERAEHLDRAGAVAYRRIRRAGPEAARRICREVGEEHWLDPAAVEIAVTRRKKHVLAVYRERRDSCIWRWRRQGTPMQEIADRLGISVSHVKRIAARGRQ